MLPWPTIGGTEIGTHRLVETLSDAFRAIALCPRGAAPVGQLFAGAGVPVIEYDPVEPSRQALPAYFRATVALANSLRTHRVDLLHCADLLGAFYAAPAARLAGVPVVCHVRCRYPALTGWYQSFLRLVHRFFFVSEETRLSFDSVIARRRGAVVYDGIPTPRLPSPAAVAALREALRIPAAAPVVGMVARLAPVKDYPTLIQAARQIRARQPDTIFVVVGDHSSTAAYREHFQVVRELVEAAGLETTFRFPGQDADVIRYMSLFDVNVLSTHSEGLPLVVLEAMALGRPVVATAVGGIPEIIEDGESGFLVPPRDPTTLAERVTALLDNSELRRLVGTAAQGVVARRFTMSAVAGRVRVEYARLLRP